MKDVIININNEENNMGIGLQSEQVYIDIHAQAEQYAKLFCHNQFAALEMLETFH